MATNCIIAIENDEGEYSSITCHFDGMPRGGAGEMLLNHYEDDEKIRKLIALGHISFLEKSIARPLCHTFASPVKGYTVFFGRDRNEENIGPDEYDCAGLMRFDIRRSIKHIFIYVRKAGEWYLGFPSDKDSKLLKDVIK